MTSALLFQQPSNTYTVLLVIPSYCNTMQLLYYQLLYVLIFIVEVITVSVTVVSAVPDTVVLKVTT